MSRIVCLNYQICAMDNHIKSSSDDGDLLSQSYDDGVERIVGFKHNAEFKVSTKVLKERQQFWEDLCASYSKPFSTDIEYNIATLQRCKSLSFVQYWINTGNLPYKALMEEAKNPESDMSFIDGLSSNSLLLDNVNEKPNEYHGRLSLDESSLSSSIDTAAYILSNTNTTNKVETMAILEGAKYNASSNQKKCGNVRTVQFENTVLDNNGNACQAYLPTTPSKPTENLSQQATNNLHESIIKAPTDPVNRENIWNYDSDYDGELFNAEVARVFNSSRYSNPDVIRKCSNAVYVGQKFLVDESSMLEYNTTKLSSRKKLYSGRDSPVDLVDTTSTNKIVLTKSTKNLHPALHPTCITSKKYTLFRKKQRSRFSIFNKSMLNSSTMSISSYRKRKRRKLALSHVSENSSIRDASKKRRTTANDSSKNQSCIESASSKELLSTESKLDDSVAQVDKLVNRFSEKFNHASRTYLNPRIYLRPITERDVQKYGSSEKTTVSVTGLCPVVRLIQLSESDIEKYRKPNREATRPGSLSPVVHLKQPSEFNNPKRRNSLDALGRFRHPVVRLKNLSEQDIKKYKAEIDRSEYSGTAYVPHNSSKYSNSLEPGSKTVHLIVDSDSDESTLLMCECKSSASQNRSFLHNISIENRQPSSSIRGASKNRILVRKRTSNEYTGSNNNALYNTLETAQNGFCRNKVIDSSSNSSSTVERRSLQKNHKETSVSSLKTSKSVLPEEGSRQNHEAISCSDESEVFNKDYRSNSTYASSKARTKRKSYNFLLSDEDDEFVNLIYYPEQRRNSKIRSPYNSPRKNSDDSESIGQNAKFEKQTDYLYRKRTSKNLLYLSEEENINRENPVCVTRSSLSSYKPNEPKVVLRDRRKMLTTMNINRNKNRLHTLRFQTKIFDSDSESSYF